MRKLYVGCEKISIDALSEEGSQLQHPSHPDHPLTLMRKSAFAFYCDGCGTQEVEDMAYICIICQFWIHKACARLPFILPTGRHHHQLSLAFSIPEKHREYIEDCDVCRKRFDMTCWVYFCGDCRFFAHVGCAATSTNETTKRNSNLEEDDDGSDVVQFPLLGHDIAEKLITSFIMREKGPNKIPDSRDMPTTVNMPETTAIFSFLFNYHKHSLTLVLESIKAHKKIIEEEEEKDEDEEAEYGAEKDEDEDEEAEYGAQKDELKICELCVTPISSPPYYECASSKNFIHSICYLLPETLSLPSLSSSSSSPQSTHHLLGECPVAVTHKIHKFKLYKTSPQPVLRRVGYGFDQCGLCKIWTNGAVYECEYCPKKMDVKCASLPTSIRHSSHPHHKPLIMTELPREDGLIWKDCHGCGNLLDSSMAYFCSTGGCDFSLHLRCAHLPPSIRMREWDKHPLQLMFDAPMDHPDDFVCDFCETKLNPKKWMYHCRPCDTSFHIFCFKAASGEYRNMKFGRKAALDGVHPHPLTFSNVTLVKTCAICRGEVYDEFGFECVSCSFAICLPCGLKAVGY